MEFPWCSFELKHKDQTGKKKNSHDASVSAVGMKSVPSPFSVIFICTIPGLVIGRVFAIARLVNWEVRYRKPRSINLLSILYFLTGLAPTLCCFGTEDFAGLSAAAEWVASYDITVSGAAFGPCPRATSLDATKRRKEEKKKRTKKKKKEVGGGAKERSETREGLAWSGISGGQESEDGALRRNPCLISCVCSKLPAPRPRHLVPLLGELDVSLLLSAVLGPMS